MQSTARKEEMSSVLDGLTAYWSQRSKGYSNSNLHELHSDKRDVWLELLLTNAPKGKRLNVLDVGAGPGFFSLLMASAGHEVTAVDVTLDMLRQAKENANEMGLKITCQQIFGSDLPFANHTFDLVINRNVVWNIEDPCKAFQEWQRVLKPGGRVVYFDANWYLYLYDEKVRRAKEEAQKDCLSKFGNLHFQQMEKITVNLEEIAKDLVLSKEHRPSWDKKILTNMGMEIVDIDENIGQRVWEERDQTEHAANPLFMVVAQKAGY